MQLFGQQYAYKPDSLISYTMHGLDSNSKRPLEKILYNYDKDYNLIEKKVFIWQQMKNSWERNSRSTFSKYANETLEFYFEVRGTNEIKKYRQLYKHNPQDKIIEITRDKKEVNEIIVLSKILFEYTKDTLRKIDYFKSSTTFFKEKTKTYSYLKPTITETITYFNEQNPSYKINHHYVKELNTIQKTSKLSTRYEDKLSDTLLFTRMNEWNQPIADTLLKRVKTTPTKNKDTYFSATEYNYTSNRQLSNKIEYKLLPSGKIDPTKTIHLTVYYTNEKAPVVKLQSGEYYIH